MCPRLYRMCKKKRPPPTFLVYNACRGVADVAGKGGVCMKNGLITSLLVLAVMLFLQGCGDRTGSITKDKENMTDNTQNEMNVTRTRSAKTEAVYKYICDNYKDKILSAQQESTWMGSSEYEMYYLEDATGKLPAIRGLDFMGSDFEGVVKRAKEWDQRGGIVTICWHTGVSSSGYKEASEEDPDFKKLLSEGTDEYNELMASWDLAAKALCELRDADVPVLWRPFHEFDGKWFWWGKGGKKAFIRLWQLMHDKFTYEYGLDNLIWVLGYSGEVRSGWYPGDDYVDVIGSDTYDGTTNLKAWKKLLKITDTKPMAFHECGMVPSPEMFEKDGDVWAWFMIWHTTWLTDNDKERLKEVYNSDRVVTLDELPDFGTDDTSDKSAETIEGGNMDRFKDMVVELPPEGYDERREGVTYPEFKKYTYYSKTAGRETNVNVLLPVDYSEDKEYPVLYVLHGFFDNEDWMARNIVALPEILTNLCLDKEAKEMIVVLPYIFCSKEMPACTGMDLANCYAYDNFINDLTTDLMPFIESSFKVKKGPENTAVTGFSMGGRESLFIGFEHPELFGFIGAVCPAPGLVKIEGSPMHPGQMTKEAMKFMEFAPEVLFISSSKADGVVTNAPDSYRKIMTDNGVTFVSHVLSETGHDHTSVKPHLYNYFRMLF